MDFARKAAVLAAVSALVCMPLAACGKKTDHQAATSPTGLAKFYQQTVHWGPCGGFGSPDDELGPEIECTRIQVPVDYEHPDGKTAQIAMSRAKATGQRIGSLLFNPGGPGASGLGMATTATGGPISARFDRVGFDPRGVGSSTPTIKCLEPKEADASRLDPDWDNSPEGIARQEQDHKDYSAKCAKRTPDELLGHVGTREVVQDMDIMRALLGDAKLNYVGYSYGTRLGWAYAEKFPGKVRAMVLDGAVDPDKNPVEESLGQTKGFQRVFDAYAESCASKPDCPLGQDPKQAAEVFRRLTVPLEKTPVAVHPKKGGDRTLSYGDALTGVQQALYSPGLWKALTAGLNELKEGKGNTLLRLADAYDGRRDDGSYDNLSDAFTAIRCVDGPPIGDRATVDKLDLESRKNAPFLDDGNGTGHAPLDVCSFWSEKPTSMPHTLDPAKLKAEGLPQLVVVSTTDDPATPYQSGVDLAKQLGAALITYKGNQHTVTFNTGSQCVDDAVISYLVDLKAPPKDLTCNA
ncbi:MAG: alpha/beta fold hydrolase [Mycobacteriaceae bacterium]|nr:alpha/beta fold hydrolase [Mycobacteriaceae bacterium]